MSQKIFNPSFGRNQFNVKSLPPNNNLKSSGFQQLPLINSGCQACGTCQGCEIKKQENACDVCGTDWDLDNLKNTAKDAKQLNDDLLQSYLYIQTIKRGQLERMKKELDNAKGDAGDRDNLQDELNKLRREKAQIQADQIGLQIAAQDNGKMKNQLDQMMKERKQMMADMDDLEASNRQLDGKKAQFRDELQDKLDKLLRDRAKMLADIAALEKLNKDTKGKLGKALQDNDQLQGNLNDLSRENGRLLKDKQDADDDIQRAAAKAQAEIAFLKEQNQDQISKMAQALKDRDAFDQNLNSNKEKGSNQLRQDLLDKEDHIRYLHEQLDQALRALQVLKQHDQMNQTQFGARCDELLKDNQRMKKVIDQLNGDLKFYKTQR